MEEYALTPAATMTSGIRGLARFAEGARVRLAVAAALAAISTAAELVPFYAVYRAVDAVVRGEAVGGEAGDGLAGWAWAALAGVLVRYALFGLALYVSHLAAYDLLYRLRVRMAERLTRVPLGWFSDRRSGALKKVMADDVERLEIFLAHAVPDLAAAVTVGAATTAWLLGRDWRMGLAAVVVVPAAFACMARSLRRSNERVVGYHESMGAMNAGIVEHVRGLPVIKIFNRSSQSVAETEAAVREHARLRRRSRRRRAVPRRAAGDQRPAVLPGGRHRLRLPDGPAVRDVHQPVAPQLRREPGQRGVGGRHPRHRLERPPPAG